jgi:hypothetical protein
MSVLTKQIHEHVAQLPHHLQTELLRYILQLEKKAEVHADQKQAFATALEKAATLNPFSEIIDPIVWQCEQRQDRILPNREQ